MDNSLPLITQKILIVDDSSFNIKVLTEELKNDHEILIATSGEEALQKVSSTTPPDLILLDILMPDMNGYEVLKCLKENKGTQRIPVIFITSKDTEQDEVEGLALGAVDYISKPFHPPILRARIKTHLELKQKTDMLESISRRDGLTGVFNRREFDRVLKIELNRSIRSGQSISMILIDLDFFKMYNDNYGHLIGDDCLKTVAETLSNTVNRAGDFVARYGGEEFVIILPGISSDKAWLVAEKIRKKVEGLKIEHNYSPISPYITVSMGVASTVPSLDSSCRILIKMADNALYEAKDLGRNQVMQVF